MQPFTHLTATAVPLRAENVDTDQIIPARFLTAVTKAGMGDGLFSSWRYNRDGSPKPEFVLNQPEYTGAEILIAGRNFGSGSSREHAVWALTEYGFRCVITPGFADIFYNNSLKNGLLPVTLPEPVVNMLLDLVEEEPEMTIAVDLVSQTVTAARRPTASLRDRSIPQNLSDWRDWTIWAILCPRKPRLRPTRRSRPIDPLCRHHANT